MLPFALELDHRHSFKVDHILSAIPLLHQGDPIAGFVLHLIWPFYIDFGLISYEERERLERIAQEKPG
jgi:hypothetical protein